MTDTNTLVERLKETPWPEGTYLRELMDEAIAALSPVLPEDVQRILKRLDNPKGWALDECEKARDLIERLARALVLCNEDYSRLCDQSPVLPEDVQDVIDYLYDIYGDPGRGQIVERLTREKEYLLQGQKSIDLAAKARIEVYKQSIEELQARIEELETQAPEALIKAHEQIAEYEKALAHQAGEGQIGISHLEMSREQLLHVLDMKRETARTELERIRGY